MRRADVALALFIAGMWQVGHPAPGVKDNRVLRANLEVTVARYRLQNMNFIEALAKVGSDFKIPMGIAWVSTPRSRALVNLSWRNATVGRILETLTKTQPGYKMSIMTNVVRISPTGLFPETENPLELGIDSYAVEGVSVERASRELHMLVKRKLRPPMANRATRQGSAESGASNLHDPKIYVRLENTTLERALDALAAASARKVWIVTFSEDSGLTAAGFRRTLTLWNDFPIPDEDQPLWDLLHWGDPIPRATSAMK